MATNTERPLRLCDVCGGLDDHPRHVQGLPPDSTEGTPSKEFFDALDARIRAGEIPPAPVSAYAELLNPQTIVRHMDCCAAQGCEICAATEQEYGERRGQALIDHLEEVRSSDG